MNPHFIIGADVHGLFLPSGVEVDREHVYWTMSSDYLPDRLHRIGRAKLNGTHVNADFITHVGGHGVNRGPWGLAVDRRHVYRSNYSHRAAGAIARARLDGTYVNRRFITRVGRAGAVAVDRGG